MKDYSKLSKEQLIDELILLGDENLILTSQNEELNKQLALYGVVNCNCDESKQLEEEFEIKHLINDTYQVVGKESNTVWKQGTMEECNDWVML